MNHISESHIILNICILQKKTYKAHKYSHTQTYTHLRWPCIPWLLRINSQNILPTPTQTPLKIPAYLDPRFSWRSTCQSLYQRNFLKINILFIFLECIFLVETISVYKEAVGAFLLVMRFMSNCSYNSWKTS